MSSGSPVEAVRRAFALLEELNRQRINSIQHLHEATALPKSTIVRLLDLEQLRPDLALREWRHEDSLGSPVERLR
jgi:hypothetical protein